MKTYKIRVTRTDIARGQKQALVCPVFSALLRKIKNLVAVCRTDIALQIDERYVFLPMTKKVQKWITRFDKGRVVKPFQFTLKVP